MWGPHTIDCFASACNAQLDRFHTRFAEFGSLAIDSFTTNWEGENNWWCPPLCLVPRLLKHAQACRATGSLIVPLWESAPYWPVLWSGIKFRSFVLEWFDLPLSDKLFLPTRSGSVLFDKQVPNTRVLALRVSFAV